MRVFGNEGIDRRNVPPTGVDDIFVHVISVGGEGDEAEVLGVGAEVREDGVREDGVAHVI